MDVEKEGRDFVIGSLVRTPRQHDAISPPKPVREDWSRSRDLAPGHVTIVQMSRDLPSRSRDHPGVTWANSTRDPKGKVVYNDTSL